MTNRKLKKMIREAFAHETPDISQEIMVDTLLSEPQDREEIVTTMEEQRKPIRFPIFSVAAAACAAIAVLAISINLIANRPQSGSAALITAEEALNAVQSYPFDKPTAAVAPNVDCQLDDTVDTPHYDVTLSYAGLSEYKFVVDAKTGEVLSMEQIHQQTDTKDPITVEEAMLIVLKAAQLEESQITDCVFEMYLVTDDPHYDISFRKGNGLYRYKVDPYTGEILEMETEPTAEAFISENDAKAIALVSVQLTESQITAYSSDFEYDSRNPRYDITFVADNIKYDFEIHAITGNVLDFTTESTIITVPDTNIVVITPVEVVLRHAGFTLEEVVNLECHEDLDDETPHIDVSFIANDLKYEYEVKAGGTILSFETEPMEEDFISASEATAKFYQYLNISPAPLATNLTYNLVAYQGRICYDIIHTNSDGSAIRMKIDATTGALLLKETPDGLQPVPSTDPTPPDGKISADHATYVALKQVGLSSTRLVADFELEEDLDDEYPHYDISFKYLGVEYEFEIGMYDGGQILQAETEPAD